MITLKIISFSGKLNKGARNVFYIQAKFYRIFLLMFLEYLTKILRSAKTVLDMPDDDTYLKCHTTKLLPLNYPIPCSYGFFKKHKLFHRECGFFSPFLSEILYFLTFFWHLLILFFEPTLNSFRRTLPKIYRIGYSILNYKTGR